MGARNRGSISGNRRGASIAMDGSGNLHVSYLDNVNRTVKYATNASGAWTFETICTDLSSWYVAGGLWPSCEFREHEPNDYTNIAIDSKGYAHVVFFNDLLKYATNNTGSWITSTVDSKQGGRSPSIDLDAKDQALIVYIVEESEMEGPSCAVMSAVYDHGAWHIQMVRRFENLSNAYLAFDSNDKAYVACKGLVYVYASDFWVLLPISFYGLGGDFVSFDIDNAGQMHFVYAVSENITHAFGNNEDWESESIVVEEESYIVHKAFLEIDLKNNLHIVYFMRS